MGAKADVEFQGEGAQMLRTLKAIEGGFDALTKSIEKQEKSTKDVADNTNKLFSRMESGAKSALRDVAAIATGWASVSGAIRIANNEYDKHIAKSAMARDKAVAYDSAIADTMQNVQTFRRPALEAAFSRTAARVGTDATSLALSGSEVSSRGLPAGMNEQGFADFIGAAYPLAPTNAEDRTAVASAAMSLRGTIAGASELSPEGLMGYLQSASKGSTVNRLRDVMPAYQEVIAAAVTNDLDHRGAIIIFNAITRAAGQRDPEKARTQTIEILNQLNAVRKRYKLNTKDPLAILAFIRSKPGLGASTVKDLGTRAALEGVATSMFTDNNGLGVRRLSEADAEMPRDFSGAVGAYQQNAARMGEGSLAGAMRSADAMRGAASELLLGNPQLVEAAAVRPELEALQKGGLGWALEDTVDLYKYDYATMRQGRDASDYLNETIGAKIGSLRSPKLNVAASAAQGRRVESPATGEDLRQAAVLEAMLERLTRIADAAQASAAQAVSTNGDRPASPANPMVPRQSVDSESSAGKPGAY